MERDAILWWGKSPPPPEVTTLCRARDIALIQIDRHPSDTEFAGAKGLIVEWDGQPQNDAMIAAVKHGLTPVFLCDFPDVPKVGDAIDRIAQNGKHLIFIETASENAIRRISRTAETPAWKPNLSIIGGEKLRSAEDTLLLSRAFSDCSSLTLVPVLQGSTSVFQAYARLINSRAGPVALPFFVKFGSREAIDRELRNYMECTTLHVPFNQRPNLDASRCALGFARGVIVGNFVERSESLQAVVDRGAGLPALQSLFDVALKGWRQQAHLDRVNKVAAVTLTERMRLCLPSTYKQKRRDTLASHVGVARQDLGATLSYEDLEKRLLDLPVIKFRYAMAHNDLHGENVRVTGQDAILIDFASTGDAPLSADPSALDVSLVLATDSVYGEAWEGLARSLYNLESLSHVPLPVSPETKGARIAQALRFLRQVALADTIDPLEYPIAVALQLLRKASYADKSEIRLLAERQRRRALAYAMAESLTLAIENEALGRSEISKNSLQTA